MAIGTPWIGTAVQGNVAGSNATTVTVDVSGAPSGEVVFIFGTVGDAQTAAMTAPSGWAILGQQSEGTSGGSSSRTIIYWKVKTSADTNVVIPTWTVTSKPQFVAMCWPGVDTTTPTEGLTWLAHTSGTSYVTGTATPTAADRWAVGVYSSRGTTATASWSNSTQTQRMGVIDTSSIFVGLSVADSNGAVTQASHSYTATGQTSSHGLGAILYLIPASGNTPRPAGVAVGNSNSASYQLSVPGGTVNGDLLVGVVASDFGTSAGNALGTGWTAFTTSQSDGGTNGYHVLLWGRVASSEPASYTVSHDSSDSVGAILRIVNWDSSSGLAGAVAQVSPNTADSGLTAPAITPNGTDDLLITFHSGENASSGGTITWTAPSGMTEQVDRQSTTWTSLEVNTLLNPSSPSGTKAATASGATPTAGAACTLSIKSTTPSGGGSASLAVTSTTSASGGTGGDSSLATTATVTPTGSVVFSGGSTQATTAAITASGVAGKTTGSTQAITAGVTAGGSSTSAPSLAATATITAAGAVTGANSATLAVTSTITAAGTATGSASTAVTAAVVATGNVATSSGATIPITATINASSGGGTSSGAALTTTAATTATGGTSAAPSLTATVTITAAGVVGKSSGAAIAVTSTVTATPAGAGISTGSVVAATATTAAAGGTSGAVSQAFTATVTAAGAIAGSTGSTTSGITVSITASGVVGRASSATQQVTVTVAASGAANLQRTASLIVAAAIVATGVNNSTEPGTSTAGDGPVPSSSPGPMVTATATAGTSGVPSSTGG